jgi:DNA-binding NarL/FixJ family response regulator
MKIRRPPNIIVIGSDLLFPKDLKLSIERACYRCEVLYIQHLPKDILNKLRDFEVVVMDVNTPEAEALFKRIRHAFPDMYIIVYSLDKDIKEVRTDFSTDDKADVVDATDIRRKTEQIMELLKQFWLSRTDKK